MKKIIIMMFIILLVLMSTHIKAQNQSTASISEFESEVKKILKTVSPSILKVVAENHKKNFATGIAIDKNYVVSNIVLTQRPFSRIYIETVNGKKFAADMVGKDYKSSLILLKIKEKALTPIKQAHTYEVGDWVALVGAFYREFPSIYQGIISSVLEDQVILNAPVVPGASGGAVLNKDGELIGVIRGRIGFAFNPDYTFKDHSSEIHIESSKSQHRDLCAATPVAEVVEVTNDLEKYGKVRRGWLGVQIISERDEPIKISAVIKNSPAAKAGLREGDAILGINGKMPNTPNDVTKIVRTLKPDQKVKIDFQRGNTRETALVVIGEADEGRFSWTYRISPKTNIDVIIPEMDDTLPRPENYIYSIGGNRTLGVDLVNLTPELAQEFKVKEGIGLMISKIYKDMAADKAGLRTADIIVKAGSQNIKTYSDLRNVLNELGDNDTLVLEVYRKGKSEKIKVVPDKRNEFTVMFDRFRDKMQNVFAPFDEERQKQIQEKLRKERKQIEQQAKESYIKEIQEIKDQQLQEYKKEIERMRQEQEKMRKEMEKMKQELEKKKKEQQQTTITI